MIKFLVQGMSHAINSHETGQDMCGTLFRLGQTQCKAGLPERRDTPKVSPRTDLVFAWETFPNHPTGAGIPNSYALLTAETVGICEHCRGRQLCGWETRSLYGVPHLSWRRTGMHTSLVRLLQAVQRAEAGSSGVWEYNRYWRLSSAGAIGAPAQPQ